MQIFKMFLLSTIFMGMIISVSAQKNPPSPEKDFDEYDRNITQTPTPKPSKLKKDKSKNPKKDAPPKNSSKSKFPKISPKPKPPKVPTKTSVGLPGMKIWLERQTGCDGDFLVVASDFAFQSGDCVRVRFRLNFQGFLTIINWGTSGNREVIFPLDSRSNQIFPKTDNFLPDNQGWEFDDQAGNEQLVFIDSRSDVSQTFVDELLVKRDLVTTNSDDLEIYDRDLKPRTGENKSVYVLASDERLEKPLVFRLTLKHR